MVNGCYVFGLFDVVIDGVLVGWYDVIVIVLL